MSDRTLGGFITTRAYLQDHENNPDKYAILAAQANIGNIAKAHEFPMYSITLNLRFVLSEEATEEDKAGALDITHVGLIPEVSIPFVLAALRRVSTDAMPTNPDEPMMCYMASECFISSNFIKGRDEYELAVSVSCCDAQAYDSISRKPLNPDTIGFKRLDPPNEKA